MELKQISGAVLSTVIRLTIAIVVLYFMYNVGVESYNFGYRVFADVAMELSPGRDKEVTIVEGKSVMQIGEILEQAGLIKDAKIFYVQELLSEYHGELKPGIYTLNTSMSGTEILAVLGGDSKKDTGNEE
jgi:UPF0755 protein